MRRKEGRLRRAARPRRSRRVVERVREQPRLLFIERAPLRTAVVVEMGRDGARGRPSGFWRGTEFYRVERIVETRREHDAIYYRVIIDHGWLDLGHYRALAPC